MGQWRRSRTVGVPSRQTAPHGMAVLQRCRGGDEDSAGRRSGAGVPGRGVSALRIRGSAQSVLSGEGGDDFSGLCDRELVYWGGLGNCA
jgi:hypothetical protein